MGANRERERDKQGICHPSPHCVIDNEEKLRKIWTE
jgi:hypothetical protein